MIRDVLWAGFFGLSVLGLMVAAEIWARLGRHRSEWARKLSHVGGGLVCALFPFTIQSPWVVLGLSISYVLILSLGMRLSLFRSTFGARHNSIGVVLFPLSIFLSFYLTQGRAWLYLSAVLVLTIADALAALVGVGLGKIEYITWGERRTLEGSLSFAFAAYPCLLLPIGIFGAASWAIASMASIVLCILCTVVEATSPRGTDNLSVPLTICVLLPTVVGLPQKALMLLSVFMILIATGTVIRLLYLRKSRMSA